jgi:hypothetical protein
MIDLLCFFITCCGALFACCCYFSYVISGYVDEEEDVKSTQLDKFESGMACAMFFGLVLCLLFDWTSRLLAYLLNVTGIV